MSIKTSVQAMGLRKAYDYIDKDPRNRLPQVVSILEKFVPSGSTMDAQISGIKEILSDPENTWNKFLMSLWTDIDDDVRRSIFENFVVNGSFLESEIHDKLEAEHGCNIPWTMLIDEAFADEMLRVKNFMPAISVEGFEKDTDFRRGSGTFQKVEKAMAILKAKKLPFGISCCYTSKNVQMIGSEAYFAQMIAWGAKFCWFFTYMPVGNAAVPELMVTPEQRRFMYEQVRKFRQTKPLFTLDFWNDGEYAGGCVAGGRRYLHINANGDMEPCAFIHYSDSNIREKTVLEALKSPLFMAYHDGQPFNDNHLRPCPLLDNPEKLRAMVHASGAYSTDMESPEEVDKLTAKCDGPAERWAPVADELWVCSGHSCEGCTACKQ